MKILFVLEHFHPYIGGVEFLFWQLTNELIEQGHQVEVITTRFDKQLPKNESINGIKIHRVNCKNRFSFSIRSIPSIFKIINNYDIVHTTTYTAALPTSIVSFIKNKKSILTFHEYWGKLWNELPYLSSIQKNMYNFFEYLITILPFSKVVAVSEFTYKSLKKAGKYNNKIVKIYNGIDYHSIKQLDKEISLTNSNTTTNQEALNYIFIGRLGVSKGLDLLLEASHIFLQSNPKATLKIVIPKIPKKLYQIILNKICSFNDAKQIKIMHNLSKKELFRQMKSAAFIVIPSYSEGFCFVAAEASALNIPIISSHRGALKEVVSGKYISMDSFTAKGLLSALENAKKNEWSYKESVQFTLNESVKQYVYLYKELING
ncbi:MAG: glycosyltransferase family 4 protein [Flavobacteriaceae bacterium]